MEPDVLHSLIPIFEEFSTITALTRSVTLHWKIPELDRFDLILNEPNLMGLCAQGSLRRFSGYGKTPSGSGTVKVFIIT
jgi:hypothetical protein